ncbi:hypothetical protein CM15mP43_12970 [bacterium]|nr:MAG: hypothetical protein CM15mP43_12970 [bacterium]
MMDGLEINGPFQHFAQAQLRAMKIEPHVRGGNTGISGFILPNGKV